MSTGVPIRALTSVRGIAAWWVVVYHFREALPQGTPEQLRAVASHGYLAVDMFFILSGFVIALNYTHHFTGGVRGSFTFYSLRLARIYPLHLSVMLLFLTVPAAIAMFSTQGIDPRGIDLPYYLLSLLLMQNWGFTDVIAWNVPAWSISTELFAYLLFPILAWFSSMVINSIPAALMVMTSLLAVLMLSAATIGGGLGGNIEHFGLLRCLLEFSLGICLHRVYLARPKRRKGESDVAALSALGCFAAYASQFAADYVVMPLGFLLLIFALTDEGSVLSLLLKSRLLEWIGVLSYSTYLIHYLVKIWTKFLLVRPEVPDGTPFLFYVVTTAILSFILYHSIERPGQRWATSHIRRSTQARSPSRSARIRQAMLP